MSQYAASRGAIITSSTPPRCDACGRVMTSHRKRWAKLHARAVLICHECRALANPAIRRARINHIHKLLTLETARPTVPRLCEPTSPGLDNTCTQHTLVMQRRHSVSPTLLPTAALATAETPVWRAKAGQGSVSETLAYPPMEHTDKINSWP